MCCAPQSAALSVAKRIPALFTGEGSKLNNAVHMKWRLQTGGGEPLRSCHEHSCYNNQCTADALEDAQVFRRQEHQCDGGGPQRRGREQDLRLGRRHAALRLHVVKV